MRNPVKSTSSPLPPTRRSFGVPNALGIQLHGDAGPPSAGWDDEQSSVASTSRVQPRTSLPSGHTVKSPASERPPIPSALHGGESGMTPLPFLSMTVLSITMLGEFLSANVAMPFLLFMVKGFHEFEDEADVAFYTGVLVAAFFFTQFFTSLLWATVAERHGRRIVLTLSLFGSAVTVTIFGTCTSLRQALVTRLLQGIFAGAVGVARGTVTSVTDITNDGRAYAILGFCWGIGGVAGAIIGGSLEQPAEKWPGAFGQVHLLVKYPYLLPCAVAGSITMIGSFLSLFLGRDGGPRGGAIRLPPEKATNQPSAIPEEDADMVDPQSRESSSGIIASLKKVWPSRLPGFLSSSSLCLRTKKPSATSVPLLSSPRHQRHAHAARFSGSAYGYNGSHRLASSLTRGSMENRLRRRREYYEGGLLTNRDYSDLNFTQKLLLANENTVTNIADLWVAAAMNVDKEDLYSDREVFLGEDGVFHEEYAEQDTSRLLHSDPAPHDARTIPHDGIIAYRSSPGVRSIFSHPGVRTPSAVLDALARAETAWGSSTPDQTHAGSAEDDTDKTPSLTSQLPIPIIVQYGLLALHSTTHDQVFLSYLVTDYQSGGLNLNPADFSQLIALMCFAQIVYQFYLYPNIGPPRGRFSHLSMFRLGSLLFIPAYLTVTMYHVLAGPSAESNFILLSALAVSTAVRFCGVTFGYTAVSILLNYMTPPQAVGFANGVAQSIVSLARCIGPILGGYLWSLSTQNDPSGYPMGFFACSGACAIAVALSLFIR
ncbi:major facilitator MFS-1 [Pisolithus croceorrhizus]|nr:major facilitator MFS-1 [Pisolithus croceorrhizus]